MLKYEKNIEWNESVKKKDYNEYNDQGSGQEAHASETCSVSSDLLQTSSCT